MVSKYDVFYIIASKGGCKIADIAESMGKPGDEYQNIFNKALELEKEGYIERADLVRVLHNRKTKELFELISFCTHNGINYNLFFKDNMLHFIEKAAKKEFFSNKDVKVHPATFKQYAEILDRYGLLLIASRKPFRCKLLRHHFLVKLLSFFGFNPRFYDPKKRDLIKDLRKEISIFNKKSKGSFSILENINKNDEVKFIYLSLSLEGNPMTLPDTQKLINENIVPSKYRIEDIEETIYYRKAVELMIINAKKRFHLSLPLILEYHRIAMSQMPNSGTLRNQNVMIRKNPDFDTSDWKDIQNRLDKLLEEYNIFEAKKNDIRETIRFASLFHNEFQRIHPFIDGNSRISRLLMLHILRSHGLPVLDISLGYFDSYLDLTKRSRKRDDESFFFLVQEMTLMGLKRMNARI